MLVVLLAQPQRPIVYQHSEGKYVSTQTNHILDRAVSFTSKAAALH
jgi:hypothetical protein